MRAALRITLPLYNTGREVAGKEAEAQHDKGGRRTSQMSSEYRQWRVEYLANILRCFAKKKHLSTDVPNGLCANSKVTQWRWEIPGKNSGSNNGVGRVEYRTTESMADDTASWGGLSGPLG